MNWRCFFGFHLWTKWVKDEEHVIMRYSSTMGKTYQVGYSQDRSCTKCGIADRRKVYGR